MVQLTAPKVATRAITPVSNQTPSAVQNRGGPSFNGPTEAPVLSKVEQSKVINVNVEGLGVTPKQLSKVALGIYAKGREQASDAEFFEAVVKKDNWVASNVTDPLTGIRQHRGKDTLGLADSVGTSYQAFSDDTREKLSDRNKRRWDVMSESTRVKVGNVVMNHTAKELDGYRKVTGEALMESTMRRGENDISDLGAAVPVGLGVLQNELAAAGIEMDSPAGKIAVENFYDEIVGRATKGQMMGTPTSADITLATKTLDKYSSAMSANAIGKIRKDLETSFKMTMIGESVSSIAAGRTPKDRTEVMDMADLSVEISAITSDVKIQNEIRAGVNARNAQRNLGITNARSIAQNNYYEVLDGGGTTGEADKVLGDVSVSDGLDIKSKYQAKLRRAIADETVTQEVVANIKMKGAVEQVTAFANGSTTFPEMMAWMGGRKDLTSIEQRVLRDKFLSLSNTDKALETSAQKAATKIASERISVNFALSHQSMLTINPITGKAPFEDNKKDYSSEDFLMLKEISTNGDSNGDTRVGVDELNNLFYSDEDGNIVDKKVPPGLERDYRRMLNDFVGARNAGDKDALKTLREKIAIINDEKYSIFGSSPLSPELIKDAGIELSVASFADPSVDGGEAALTAFSARSDVLGTPIKNVKTGIFFVKMTGNRIAVINADGNVEVLTQRRR